MLSRAQETTSSFVDCSAPEWQARTWSTNQGDLFGLVTLCGQRGFIVGRHGPLSPGHSTAEVQLTSSGWEFAESLMAANPDSTQGFVAMWFDDAMTWLYDKALAPAIEAAGYRPHRVDRREYVGRVDDEIMAQVRRSRFVVADFTGHRGGVYWEAGLAEGLGLPVIFTCRETDLKDLHFDVRQQNTITWSDDRLVELTQRLRARIEAALGRGPLPLTSER
jgi:hypothetical protein